MDENIKLEMWQIFKDLGQDALVMSHYDLASCTDYDADYWKMFLMEQDVTQFVRTELEMIQDSELKKIIKDISKSNSVGQAQLMNALMKLKDDKGIKEGPVFIYNYVPLNKQQEKQNNTVVTHDIFLKENNDGT